MLVIKALALQLQYTYSIEKFNFQGIKDCITSMRNKICLPHFLFIFSLVLMAACSSSPEISVVETSVTIAVATESWTKTPVPTMTSSTTPTIISSPTVLPSPTFTSTPEPTPTETPILPEFTNLTLALDYNQDSLEPKSSQDYFPLGVSYMAVVFDYRVPSWTKLDWYIYGSDGVIEASGIASLSAGEDKMAFIVRPETGLDGGSYELIFELDGQPVLEKQFDVYWNPTIWPITIGTDVYDDYTVANEDNKFSYGTEFLYATYPTINFLIDDKIFVEWFVNDEKLGEHQYIWDNSKWSSGVHVNKIDNQVEPDNPLPVGIYEMFIYVNGKPKQCKAFKIIEENATSSDNVNALEPMLECETFTSEPSEVDSSSPWDRYEVRTFSELDDLVAGAIQFDTSQEKVVYLEMSPDFQYPSRVEVVFTGDFRDTPESKLEWIKLWMATFAPELTAEEVAELFAQEGLFKEDSKEYWLPIQNALIPIMEDELSPGDKVDLLVTWMGATIDSGQIDKIYLVNAFK